MSRNKETDIRGTEQQNDGRVAKLPKQHSNKRVMGNWATFTKYPFIMGVSLLKIKHWRGRQERIRHFRNDKRTGAEMCPAIVSAMVTGELKQKRF